MPSITALQARVDYDDSAVVQGVPRTQGHLQRFASAVGGVGQIMAGVFGGQMLVQAFNGLAGGLGTVVTGAMDFQQSMANVNALLQGTPEQMQLLSDTALKLGMDTTLAGISATDAADAMKELAAAGFTAGDIAGGAAKGVLLLASATGTDIPTAAQIAGDAFNQFRTSMGLTADFMPTLADLFAGAANASSISLQDIGASMTYIGPVAAGMGISIQNVTATIAELGNQGIKGSAAGTALRSMLVSIASPSKEAAQTIEDLGLQFFDSQGKVKDFAGISEELKVKLAGLTDQQRANALATIFGKEALSAATVMYGEGADGIKKYLDQITQSGSAAASGATRNNTLRGSIEQLKSAFETAQIALGQAFLPALKSLADWAGNAVTAAIPLIQQYGPVLVAALQQGIAILTQWGSAIWGAVSAVLGAFQSFRSGQTTLAQFIGGMEIFVSTILGKLGNLAALAAPYIGQFLSAIGSAIATYGPQLLAQLGIWAQAFVAWIAPMIPGVLAQLLGLSAAIEGWILGTALPAILARLVQLGQAFGTWITTTAIPYLQANLPGWLAALGAWITGTALPAIQTAAGQLGTALSDWITTKALPALQAALPQWVTTLVGGIQSVLPAIQQFGQSIWQGIVGAVQAIVPPLQAAWSQIQAAFATAGTYLQPLIAQWQQMGGALSGLQPLLEALGIVLGGILVAAIGLVVGALGALAGFIAGALPGAIQFGVGILQMLTGAFQVVESVIVGVVQIVAAVFAGDWAGAWQAAQTMVQNATQGIQNFWEGMSLAVLGVLNTLVGGVVGAVSGFALTVVGFFQGMYTSITGDTTSFETMLETAWTTVTNAVTTTVSGWVTAIGNFFSTLGTNANTAVTTLKQQVVDAFTTMVTTISTKIDAVITAVQGMPASLLGAAQGIGEAIVNGIVNGIKSGLSFVTDAARNLAQSAIDAAKGVLGIKSPSTVMAEVGVNVAQGLINGLANQRTAVSGAVTLITDTMRQAFGEGLAALTQQQPELTTQLTQAAQFTTVYREAMDKASVAVNVFREELTRLIAVMKTVPDRLSTEILTPGLKEAIAAVQDYAAALRSIPSSVSTSISTTGGGGGGAEAAPNTGGFANPGPGLANSVNGSGGRTNVNVTVTGNTMLGNSPETAADLARILTPELGRIVQAGY